MSSTILAAKCDARRTQWARRGLFSARIVATLTATAFALADPPQGAIVGWGEQVVGGDLTAGFIAIAAGGDHSLGLKADGSIVAWGANFGGQTDVPAPNSGFVGVTAGWRHSLAIRRVPGDADGDGDVDRGDFAVFDDYVLGPHVEPELAWWRFYDIDMDDDVDLRDLAVWQNAFTGD